MPLLLAVPSNPGTDHNSPAWLVLLIMGVAIVIIGVRYWLRRRK